MVLYKLIPWLKSNLHTIFHGGEKSEKNSLLDISKKWQIWFHKADAIATIIFYGYKWNTADITSSDNSMFGDICLLT